ncbi:MAG: hypothetical protein KH452_03235 [Clostridiales bacterium]|nr:hypothetical protein [Clostridiales bacterium]
MNENMNYPYENEREIDLIDLMFYLMKQWKTLIMAVVIGAILGSGIYVVKKKEADQKKTIDISAVTEEDTEEAIKNYKVDPDVKANMELAYQYRQLYRKQLEYNQNSPIMQMDPSKVYQGELKYYISAGYDTTLVKTLYQNILATDDILSELKDASELECEEQYIRELIGCGVSEDGDASININNAAGKTLEESSFTAKNVLITYTINSIDEESCDKMLGVIRSKVEELNQKCLDEYEDYEMTPINDSVRVIASSDYLSKQKSNADQLSNYLSNMSRLEGAFGEGDKEYYNVVYLSREYEQDEEVVETPVVEEVEPVSPVKWLVIGIFLMCVCWGGFYLVIYLMDRRIKTTDEVRSMYGISLIGRLRGKDVGKKKDWVCRLHERFQEPFDSEEYIVAAINAMGKENVILSGEMENREIKKLVETAQASRCKIEAGDSIRENCKVLEVAKNADGVIFIFVVGKTKQTEIQRELEICSIQKIPVLGSIVIE